MIIEFRKVSPTPKTFEDKLDSVKIEGSFCKIAPKLIKMDAKLLGTINVDCCKCGESFEKRFDEEIEFLVSDGEYKNDSQNDTRSLESVIIEIDDHMIDFKEIVQSELESFKLDYHSCDNCLNDED